MFIIPIVLAIYCLGAKQYLQLVNNKKIPLLIANKDTSAASKAGGSTGKRRNVCNKKIPAGDDALVKPVLKKGSFGRIGNP